MERTHRDTRHRQAPSAWIKRAMELTLQIERAASEDDLPSDTDIESGWR